MERDRFKILMISDSQDNMFAWMALVEGLFPDAEVPAAITGREGIALAEAEFPDVILLDINISGPDGTEVCRRMKANRFLKEIPVIILTAAKADKARRILALETGAEAFLALPADECELTAQMRAIHKSRFAGLQKSDENEGTAALVQDIAPQLSIAYCETPILPEHQITENSAGAQSEASLIDAQKTAHAESFEYDADAGRMNCSDGLLGICGIDPRAFSGEPEDILGLVHPDDRKALRSLIMQTIAHGDMRRMECRILRPDGRERFIGLEIAPAAAESGRGAGLTGTVQDLTQHNPAEKRLHSNEEKYRLIAESVPDVIWVYNVDQRKLTYISPSIYVLRGITALEAQQESAEQTMPPASFETLKERIAASINELKRDSGASNAALYEVQRPCSDGTLIWIEDSVISRYNAEGEIELFGISRNINERKAQEDKLRYIGFHDQLTGLYNRRFFEEELKRLDTQRNLPISLVMGDINGLKLVNDSLGHATGDKLLEKAAQVLRKACRTDDIIARLGGDEFVILLPKTSALRAAQIISRIRSLMAEEKFADIEVTISFGHDTKESEQQNMPEVLSNAESHMYRNKLYERSNIQDKTVDIIMNMLFKKSSWELMHSKRVSEICRAVATMMGLNKEFVRHIEIAGLLHDIGKIGIDEKILNKAGGLTDDEWQEIIKHSEIGWWILRSTGEFPELAAVILEHHEKWDGSGYPKGLKGEGISKEARIISVADAYDTMTCKRIYRDGISHAEAVDEIKKRSGTQFDPKVVDVLLHCILKTGSKCPAKEPMSAE